MLYQRATQLLADVAETRNPFGGSNEAPRGRPRVDIPVAFQATGHPLLAGEQKLVTAGIGKADIVGVLDASTSPPKERYAVSNDNVIKLIQPEFFDDQLTEILRNGARALLAKAVEADVADFLDKHADLKSCPRP
jgi:hypothetical protein